MEMGRINVIIVKGSGEELQANNWTNVMYYEKLNKLWEFEIEIQAATDEQRTNYLGNDEVIIKENSVPVFGGKITKRKETSNGLGLILRGTGYEILLSRRGSGRAEYINKNNTEIHTGWNTGSNPQDPQGNWDNGLLYETGISAGSIQFYSGNPLTKRYDGLNKLQANYDLELLCKHDVWVDANKQFNSSVHKGSTTPVTVLQDAKNMTVLDKDVDYEAIVNFCTVYGRGDGINQVEANSSDSGSIAQWGIREPDKPITDKSLTTTQMCQLLADKVVAENKDPKTAYKCDLYDPGLAVELGDVVTVVDRRLGIETDLRIVGRKREISASKEKLILDVGSILEEQSDESISIQKDLNIHNASPQGATNIYQVGFPDNASNSKPFILKFYIPSEAKAINHVLLNFTLENFRAYSTGSAAGGGTSTTSTSTTQGGTNASGGTHNHSVSGVTSGSSSLSTTYSGSAGDNPVINARGFDADYNWVSITQSAPSPIYGSFVGHHFNCYLYTRYSGTQNDYELYDISSGVTLASGQTTALWNQHGRFVISYSTSTNRVGHSIRYKVGNFLGMGSSGVLNGELMQQQHYTHGSHTHGMDHTHYVSGQTAYDSGSHSHTFTGQPHSHNVTISNHTHNILYGIYEQSQSSPNVSVDFNGNSIGSYTSDQTNLDVTSYAIVGAWNTLRITPAGGQLLRINPQVYIQIYIESK